MALFTVILEFDGVAETRSAAREGRTGGSWNLHIERWTRLGVLAGMGITRDAKRLARGLISTARWVSLLWGREPPCLPL